MGGLKNPIFSTCRLYDKRKHIPVLQYKQRKAVDQLRLEPPTKERAVDF